MVWGEVSDPEESEGEEAPRFGVGVSTGASMAKEAQRLANAAVLCARRDKAFEDHSHEELWHVRV